MTNSQKLLEHSQNTQTSTTTPPLTKSVKELTVNKLPQYMEMLSYARPSGQQDKDVYQNFLDTFIIPVMGQPIQTIDGKNSYNFVHIVHDPKQPDVIPHIAYMAHHDTVHRTCEYNKDKIESYVDVNGRTIVANVKSSITEPDTKVTVTENRLVWDPVKKMVKQKPFSYEKTVKGKSVPTGIVPPNCLGADCTSGIWLILEMIQAQVPGIYVVHTDEEIGRKGAEAIVNEEANLAKIIMDSANFGELDIKDKKGKVKYAQDQINELDHDDYVRLHPMSWWMDYVRIAISFDRKDVDSIITHQSRQRCCSEEFSQQLSDILSPDLVEAGYKVLKSDDSGSFTDSYQYINNISECTNLSVGYASQHTASEWQDFTFLVTLRDALIKNGHKLSDHAHLTFHRDPSVIELKTYGNGNGNFNSYFKGHGAKSGTPSIGHNSEPFDDDFNDWRKAWDEVMGEEDDMNVTFASSFGLTDTQYKSFVADLKKLAKDDKIPPQMIILLDDAVTLSSTTNFTNLEVHRINNAVDFYNNRFFTEPKMQFTNDIHSFHKDIKTTLLMKFVADFPTEMESFLRTCKSNMNTFVGDFNDYLNN